MISESPAYFTVKCSIYKQCSNNELALYMKGVDYRSTQLRSTSIKSMHCKHIPERECLLVLTLRLSNNTFDTRIFLIIIHHGHYILPANDI